MNKPLKIVLILVGVGGLLLIIDLCSQEEDESQPVQTLEVTATAYNSLRGQTLGNPTEAAWGDTLKPGMKAIAVSRDLIDSGLTYGTKVRIDDLPGEYVVRDKMNARWTKKIDIYMGTSRSKAMEWGNKKVTIHWKKTESK